MKFIDQTSYEMNLELLETMTRDELRIVSVVPSQTELLYDLGLKNQIVGITKFCIEPQELETETQKWFELKSKIGGTKNIDIEKVKSLNPHIIFANKEENDKDQIESLRKEFIVYTSDVYDLKSSLEMIAHVGQLTKTEFEAQSIISKISLNFKEIQFPAIKKTAIYFIWKNPYMTVGGDTFIHKMIEECGFSNLTIDKKRYPVIEIEEMKELNPEVIFLSSEPYPFKEKHIQEFQEILPNALIYIVDGQKFSWYGSHLIQSPLYFNGLQKLVADSANK
jgi:ABC-type Fe3+-hydroxamate transport system substrate-binding protein